MDIDVLSAAQSRIEWTFDNFENIYCSFSAGKDSGVMTHLVCEEARIPYCFVPSKLDLGHSMGSKKSACVLMIKSKDDYKDIYDKCYESVQTIVAE